MINNYTEFVGDNDQEPDTCPECGSEEKEPSHFNMHNGRDYFICLGCDEIYTLNN